MGGQADVGKTKVLFGVTVVTDIINALTRVISVVFCSNSDAQFSSGNNFCGVKPLIGVHYN